MEKYSVLSTSGKTSSLGVTTTGTTGDGNDDQLTTGEGGLSTEATATHHKA